MTTTLRTRQAAWIGLVLLGALAFLLADLVGGEPARSGTYEVVMEGYGFEPTELTVPAGQPITLAFENRDEVTHHVSFGRTPTESGGRVVGFGEDLLADLDVRVTPRTALTEPAPPYQGVTVAVTGGQRVTVEVTIPEDRAGTWQLGCFTGRGCHYQAGLAANLYVE
jgi:plastocyanin